MVIVMSDMPARVRRSSAASWRSRPGMVLVLSWTGLFAVWLVVAAVDGALASRAYWWSLLAYWAGLALLVAVGVAVERRRRARVPYVRSSDCPCGAGDGPWGTCCGPYAVAARDGEGAR